MTSIAVRSTIVTEQFTVILISSVLPQPTSAGEIILHRHLSSVDEWNIQVAPLLHEAKSLNGITKLVKRLENTRFHRWSNDLATISNGQSWNRSINRIKLAKAPIVVLTVAHGDGCWAAERFARKNRLPLVTIFHDWWPDIPAVHQPIRQLLDRRFRALYHASDLALCVSEGMQDALGEHKNSVVLYPIPELPKKSSELTSLPTKQNNQNLKVLYFGGLYDYGPMVGEFLQVVKDHPTIKVQVRGAKPNWPADFCAEMRDRGLWLDFAPRSEFNDWLESGDIFLVTMSFDPALRRRMETSFPSKLTEAVQLGKPIVIWGPDYCAAVKWAKEGDRAFCVTEVSPYALVTALEKLSMDISGYEHYAAQSRQIATQEFSPVTLQEQFLAAIFQLIQY